MVYLTANRRNTKTHLANANRAACNGNIEAGYCGWSMRQAATGKYITCKKCLQILRKRRKQAVHSG